MTKPLPIKARSHPCNPCNPCNPWFLCNRQSVRNRKTTDFTDSTDKEGIGVEATALLTTDRSPNLGLVRVLEGVNPANE